ncbi:MAG TPA: ribonuclease H-like domain-containing protein [Candidatus Acidoferrales bacterium]|nr:ribonuclease H-like domain-containing protein [Candidatus Acidoferrales bacterium]
MPPDRFARLAALRPARKHEPVAPESTRESAAEPDALLGLLGARVKRNRYGEHLEVRQWFSRPEACAPSAPALDLLLREKPEHALDPTEWLFLDTETTGLAGGTGTYAFLVGLAWWEAGGLEVEQLFMRDHGEEHSLLLELSRRMGERRVLVTFNGKSFDWPLLETRFRMTRAIPPRLPRTHLDLLHPARQLWRLRLGSVRLRELERHVLGRDGVSLGWSRQDDIDSALIPQIYFDYLHSGRPESLVAVFRHNQMDLRGLAALAGRILALLGEPEAFARATADVLELYGLSRLLGRSGNAREARRLYERALQAGLPGEVDRAARRELAVLAKRERDYARATSLWEDLISGSNDGLEAYEQLAIYHEHHARQPTRAAEFTRRALAALGRARRAGLIEPARCRSFQARLEHRLARLARITQPPKHRSLLEPPPP